MPSGSKVTPADKTKQILKSGNPIAINITVQGNVIGNEQYANQLGNMIVQKIMTAQLNICYGMVIKLEFVPIEEQKTKI